MTAHSKSTDPEEHGNFGKACAPGYKPAAFFFKQTSRQGELRLVAWSGNLDQVKSTYYKLLELFPDDVAVLLKTEPEDDEPQNRQRWIRFHGYSSVRDVREAIRAHEDYVFEDGHHQLFIRRMDTDEYFGLDEFGVLYIYPHDARRFVDVLESAGYAQRKNELLSDIGHWRYAPGNSDEMRESLISKLLLHDASQ